MKSSLYGQEACGVTVSNAQEVQQLYLSYASQPQVAATLPSKIPVWIYFIEPETYPMGYTLTQATNSVPLINEYFTGLFEFSVCGTTTITSDNLTFFYNNDPNFVSDAFAHINGLPETGDDKCLKILFVNALGPLGVAYSPILDPNRPFEESGIVLKVLSKNIIAHEIGHYFGLLHTFEGGQENQFVSMDFTVCGNTGDFLCSTPADPGGSSGDFSTDCLTYIGNQVDPLGVPYNPDSRNLMSRYYSCMNKFTGEQKSVMKTFFQVSPEFEDLRNPDAVCVNPVKGQVLAHCLEEGIENYPLESLKVIITEQNSACTRLTDVGGHYNIKEQPCQVNSGLITVSPRKSPVAGESDPEYLLPFNGVTGYDFVLISRNILNLEPFDNPYKFIAADVNGSGTITTFDIVLARQVLLGTLPDFPVGSWRYVPHQWFGFPSFNNQFFNTNNPFAATASNPINGAVVGYNTAASWMDKIQINTLPTGTPFNLFESTYSFSGVKVADIDCNGSGDPLIGEDPSDGFVGDGGAVSIPNNSQALVEIIVSSPVKIVAWQMGIDYSLGSLNVGAVNNGTTDIALTSDEYAKTENTATQKGQLNLCWFSETGTSVDMNNKSLFKLSINSKTAISNLEQLLQLNKSHLKTMFFDEFGNRITNVQLRLKLVNQGGLGVQIPVEDRVDDKNLPIAAEIQVNPVPFDAAFVVSIQSPTAELTSVKLLDVNGKEVYSAVQHFLQGKNDLEIFGLDQLPNGVYALVVQNKSYTISKKIVK